MDICNCIWRGKAFNSTDPNALGCLIPLSLNSSLTRYVTSLDIRVGEQAIGLGFLFGLSFSPLLARFAISFMREKEDENEETIVKRHAGPVTAGSLKILEAEGGLELSWADYRLGVLRYLEAQGIPGVGEMMYNTMKHLMTAREKMA
jgi:centromere protein I